MSDSEDNELTREQSSMPVEDTCVVVDETEDIVVDDIVVDVPDSSITSAHDDDIETMRGCMGRVLNVLNRLMAFTFRVKLTDAQLLYISKNILGILNKLIDKFPVNRDFDDFSDMMESSLVQPFSVVDESVGNIPMSIVWKRSTPKLRLFIYTNLQKLCEYREIISSVNSKSVISPEMLGMVDSTLRSMLNDEQMNSTTM